MRVLMFLFFLLPTICFSQVGLPLSLSGQAFSFTNPGMIGYGKKFTLGITYNTPHKMSFLNAEWSIQKSKKEIYAKRSLKLYDIFEFYRQESPQAYLDRKGEKHGLGVMLSKEKLNKYEFETLKVNYSRHLRISNSFLLSAGFSVGITNTISKQIITEDKSDRDISIDFGYMIYNKRFFVGHSIKNVISAPLHLDNPKISRMILPKQYLILGMEHYLFYPFSATTRARVSKSAKSPYEYDLSGFLKYQNRIKTGFQLNDAGIVQGVIGLQFKERLYLDYVRTVFKRKTLNYDINRDEVLVSIDF